MLNNSIKHFIIGPLLNNTYVLLDHGSKKAIVIDPAIGSKEVIMFLQSNSYLVTQIWITHAHYDHFAGILEFLKVIGSTFPVYLHPEERDFFESGGGSKEHLGKQITIPDEIPRLPYPDSINFGENTWKILHTPGHRPGHVVIYSSNSATAFCGDLIFKRSIGRTDLPGGNYEQIISSINQKILTLPDETVLLPGHGQSTIVKEESLRNPFLK